MKCCLKDLSETRRRSLALILIPCVKWISGIGHAHWYRSCPLLIYKHRNKDHDIAFHCDCRVKLENSPLWDNKGLILNEGLKKVHEIIRCLTQTEGNYLNVLCRFTFHSSKLHFYTMYHEITYEIMTWFFDWELIEIMWVVFHRKQI